MAVVTEPGVAVLSGPVQRRGECERALKAAGFKCLDAPPLPAELGERPPHRGLPAHRNPDEALAAGVPNAGHTPGTGHPDTGEPYQDDPRVAFLDVQVPDREGALDALATVAASAKFVLRLHCAPVTTIVPDISIDEHIALAEAHLVAAKQMRGGRA
jgi:hypothetical protein